MIKISPSILSADFAKMGEDTVRLEKAGADLIHVDVMDGAFVPNITFGQPMVAALKKVTNVPLDVHLMIEKPERYVEEFADAGADIITVHAEATTHLQRTLQLIRGKGKKAGVVLNPATSLTALDYVYDDVDMILLMSVNPGFGGQSFIPAVMQKIRDLKKIIDEKKLPIDIEIDGGVNFKNAAAIKAAGANVLVAGSAVFGADDLQQAISKLRNE